MDPALRCRVHSFLRSLLRSLAGESEGSLRGDGASAAASPDARFYDELRAVRSTQFLSPISRTAAATAGATEASKTLGMM